jgi:hypothetical protein
MFNGFDFINKYFCEGNFLSAVILADFLNSSMGSFLPSEVMQH